LIKSANFFRLSSILGILFFIIFLSTKSVYSAKRIERYGSQYKAALLADANSGRILFNERMHDKIYPASLVKMMVSLIALEEIDSGRINLQDSVKVSRWASKIGGHQVYLKQGEIFKFSELMKATVISSANDASVAVAKHVLGSVKDFIKKMNERAYEIGMKNTRFFSVHGLPPGRGQKLDVSTAYDLLLLALELIKHPQFLSWSSTRLDSFRNGTFQLLNTNHRLIRSYHGMEGMKTGYHRKAGFNLVSSVKRGSQRYISIVLGTKGSRLRSKITRHLLDYAFENYRIFEFKKENTSHSYFATIKGGELEHVSLKANETLTILLSNDEFKRLQIIANIPLQTLAPITLNQSLGTLQYWLDGQMLGQIGLQSENAVQKKSILSEVTSMIINLSGTN